MVKKQTSKKAAKSRRQSTTAQKRSQSEVKSLKRTIRILRFDIGVLELLVVVLLITGIGMYFVRAAIPAAKGTYVINNCARTDTECYYWSKQGYISQVYKGLYGNAVTVPDKSGLEYWVGLWGNANTPGNMAGHILNSISANDAAANVMKSGTSEQFVDELYRRYLQREADAGGKSFWLGQLGDGGIQKRADIMINFAGLDEVRNKWQNGFRDSLNAYYPASSPAPTTSTTGSAPAPAPTTTTSTTTEPANPQAGNTQQYFANTCQGNTECMYASREGVIIRVYYALNGAFDKEGFKYWVGQYAAQLGDNPEYLARAMTESASYIKNQNSDQFVTGLYVRLMERQPDSSGKAYWMGRLGDGNVSAKGKLILEFTNLGDVKAKANYQSKGKTFAGVVADNIHNIYADPTISQEIKKAGDAIVNQIALQKAAQEKVDAPYILKSAYATGSGRSARSDAIANSFSGAGGSLVRSNKTNSLERQYLFANRSTASPRLARTSNVHSKGLFFKAQESIRQIITPNSNISPRSPDSIDRPVIIYCSEDDPSTPDIDEGALIIPGCV